MKITYARLYNLGNYENERFEVEDEVSENETAGYTSQRLRDLVEELKKNADWDRDQRREQEREALQRDRAREAAEAEF